jgi:hypothetical protein
MSRRILRLLALLVCVAAVTGRAQPFISEFMAANTKTLVDVDGDFSDWIEIQNPASTAVSLNGWFLTDNAANLTKWRIPNVSIPARGFRIIFASGKDRTNSAAQLHTSFSLAAGGEYLALVQPDGTTVASQFSPEYPAQQDDVSYGSVQGTNYFFSPATPGASNVVGFIAKLAPPGFSEQRGLKGAPFSLVLDQATGGAVIRYTTNGSAPTATTGLVYGGPVAVNGTTTIRAAAYRTGYQASDSVTHTYLFPADIVNQSPTGQAPWSEWPAPRTGGGQVYDYGMDPDITGHPTYGPQVTNALRALPSISIVMDLNDLFKPSTGIYANPSGDERVWERPASAELIQPDGSQGFQINCGIRLRGGFSRSTSNPKHSFRLFFRSDYGPSKLKYQFYPGGGATEYDKIDLRTMQNYSWAFQGDSQMICVRDIFSRQTQIEMGRPATRGDQFYHLYINGQYWGLYNTEERADASYGEMYFGGKAEEYDAIKVDPDLGYLIEATDGTVEAWRRLWQAGTNGFAGNDAYFRVQGRNPDGTPNPAFENLLDVPSLIDYMLIILYGGNLDSPISNFLGNTSPNNWFGIRHTNGLYGGFQFFVHDAEHTLLDVNSDRTGPYPAGDPAQGSSFGKSNPQYLWQRLQANAEFRLFVADHVQRHLFNGGVLSAEAARARMLTLSNSMDLPIIGESARWGDAKVSSPFTQATWRNTYRNVMASFTANRTTVFLNQLRSDGLYPVTVLTPSFSQRGGKVSPGQSLTLTAPAGTIYYTTDGSDPRQIGGGVSLSARTYTSAIPIDRNTLIRVRALNGVFWSALDEALFVVDRPLAGLLVSEIMYHPAAAGLVDGDEFEFLEFKNVSGTALDLGGVVLSNAISFRFPLGASLDPGQFLVLAGNPTTITNRYPGLGVFGGYQGRLNNAGETLEIRQADGTLHASISYGTSPPWPISADGAGFSLVPVNPAAQTNSSDASAWRASSAVGGSPGKDDPSANVAPIRITEVLTHTDPPLLDSIELFNPTTTNVDVSGWFLTDNAARPAKFRIPDATVIAPGGYLVFDETQFDRPLDSTNRFTLNSHGEEVYLFSSNPLGELTGHVDGFAFPAGENGVSFGRLTNSEGRILYLPQTVRTFGAANAGPRIGPVVINEIRYAPADGEAEFVELRNIAATNVPLYDVAAPTNTWKINGLGFTFPQNVVLPANGIALVVGSDPAAFRSRYSVPAAVPVFGPFTGALQNGGEMLQVLRPDKPDLTTNGPVITTFVPYLVVDQVRYDQNAPWPTGLSGTIASIERIDPATLGDEPLNWRASPGAPSPGYDNFVNRPPIVSVDPDRTLVVASFPVTVSLAGSVLDDGKPNPPGSVTAAWSGVAGPAPVSFGNPSALATTATINWPGQYRLQLAASDGVLSNAAVASINVVRQVSAATLVPAGSVWKYSDTRGDLGTAWREPGYNDSAWSSGPGPLGGGDSHIVTTINLGSSSNRTLTHYFRRQFSIGAKADLAGLSMLVLRDDGAIVYLNGTEVFRSNLADGAVTFGTLAVYAVGNEEETQYFDSTVDPSLLVDGVNTLAVEVHQINTGSSDLGFDLELLADSLTPLVPRVHGVGLAFDTGGEFRAAFPAEAGRTYSVQYRDNAATGPWRKLLDFPAVSEADALGWTDPVPNGATNRFYRVVTPAVP